MLFWITRPNKINSYISSLNRYIRYVFYCLEVLIQLVFAKVIILLLPFNKMAKTYGYPYCETLHEPLHRFHPEIAMIKRSFQFVLKIIPWRSVCLDQAIAMHRMLSRRHLQSTFYFGVKMDDSKKLIAHAWIRCGSLWMIGYQGRGSYTVVCSYANIMTGK